MYFLSYFIFNSADNHHFRCFLIGFWANFHHWNHIRSISMLCILYALFRCSKKPVSNNHVYLFFLLCDLNIILRLLSSQWQMKCFSNRLRSVGTNFCWIRFWFVCVCLYVSSYSVEINVWIFSWLLFRKNINLNSSSHTHIKIDSCYFDWIHFQ